jgi:TonB family protein
VKAFKAERVFMLSFTASVLVHGFLFFPLFIRQENFILPGASSVYKVNIAYLLKEKTESPSPAAEEKQTAHIYEKAAEEIFDNDNASEAETAAVFLKNIQADIMKKLAADFEYPVLAVKRGISGTVLIHTEIAADGTLIKISINKSSGSKLLDESAVENIRKLFPYKHNTGRSLNLVIPVVYRLE